MFIKRVNMKNWQRFKIQYNNTIGKCMGKLATSSSTDRNRFAITIKMTKTQNVFDSAIAFLEMCTGETFTCVSMGQCSQMLIPRVYFSKRLETIQIFTSGRGLDKLWYSHYGRILHSNQKGEIRAHKSSHTLQAER